MSQELDAAAITASLMILGILLSSATLWIRHIQRPRNEIIPNAEAHPWSISWVDFLLFICAQVVIVTSVQITGFSLLKDTVEAVGDQLTPGLAIAAVLMLQIPMLGVFFLARRLFPSLYACRLNTQSYSLGAALREATPLFIMFLPIIWIASFLWSSFLSALQALGIVDEFPPQELVKIFQEGGAPVTISILVILAVILAPIVEEIIFRGCIYRFLKSKTSFIAAQILSGVVFSLMHQSLAAFIPLVVVGIILARIYEKSGNLLVPMCFHALFNGFSLLMLYIMSHSSLPQ
ncbi:MAG: lysostaphin resistance A-like protein [Lentimonas sp.]